MVEYESNVSTNASPGCLNNVHFTEVLVLNNIVSYNNNIKTHITIQTVHLLWGFNYNGAYTHLRGENDMCETLSYCFFSRLKSSWHVPFIFVSQLLLFSNRFYSATCLYRSVNICLCENNSGNIESSIVFNKATGLNSSFYRNKLAESGSAESGELYIFFTSISPKSISPKFFRRSLYKFCNNQKIFNYVQLYCQ